MTFIGKLPWVWQAVLAGLFFGHGVILTNVATRGGTPVVISVGTFGITWALAAFLVADRAEVAQTTMQTWLVLVGVGVLFFIGNLLQFSATPRAPMTGYALLAITATNVLITFVYDGIRQLKQGTLTFSPLEIGAVVCGILTLVLFVLAAKK